MKAQYILSFLIGILVIPFFSAQSFGAEEVTVRNLNELKAWIQHYNQQDHGLLNPDLHVIRLDETGDFVIETAHEGKTGLPAILTGIKIVGNGAGVVLERNSNIPTDIRLFEVRRGGRLVLENLELRNGQVTQNQMGAAVWNRGGTVTIRNSSLKYHQAAQGGAIRTEEGGVTRIEGSYLSNNFATQAGGAISIGKNSKVVLSKSTLENNQANLHGGAIWSDGDLIVNQSTLAHNRIQRSPFLETELEKRSGGAIAAFENGSVVLTTSTFFENEADVGGALYTRVSGFIRIGNCTFLDNQANEGEGIYAIHHTTPSRSGTNNWGQRITAPGRTYRSIPNLFSSILADGYSGTLELSGVNLAIPQAAGFEFTGAVDRVQLLSRREMKLGEYVDMGIGKGIVRLQPDSPAIDATRTRNGVDQLGRQCQETCDLGASEYYAFPTNLIQGLNRNRPQGVIHLNLGDSQEEEVPGNPGFGGNGQQNLPDPFGPHNIVLEDEDPVVGRLVRDGSIGEFDIPTVRQVEILEEGEGDIQDPDFQLDDNQLNDDGASIEAHVAGGGCSLNTQGSPVTDFGIMGFLIVFIAGTFRIFKVR